MAGAVDVEAIVQETLLRIWQVAPRVKPTRALDARLTGPGTPDLTLAHKVGMKLNTFLQNVTRARKLLAACLKKRGVDLEAELA